MKCKLHNVEMKEGGCFGNVYVWCPKCEYLDTEPVEITFDLITPTMPVWRDDDWTYPPVKK